MGQVLDEQGIAVRVGHHRARPVSPPLRNSCDHASVVLSSTPRRPRSTHWSTVWSTYGTSSAGRDERRA
ncbi:hypothetical protein LV779_32730 [Streptomyces thinghirensis]|nr:hypothetical protein [Streptomyces thinghirensis]